MGPLKVNTKPNTTQISIPLYRRPAPVRPAPTNPFQRLQNIVSRGISAINPYDNPRRPSPPMAPGLNYTTRSLQPYALPESVAPHNVRRAGNRLTRQTAQEYGLTPGFIDVINKGNPAVADIHGSGNLKGGAKIGGMYFPREVSATSIVIDKKGGGSNVLHHEGLHRAWQQNPKTRQEFNRLYNRSATPELKNYLAMRLKSYPDFANNPRYLDNLERAPQSVQTEVHSYAPELYTYMPNRMPQALRQYYSRYYDPNRRLDRAKTRMTVERMLNPRLYRMNREAR